MKAIILLLTLTLSQTLFAKTVARVLDIKGNAFAFVEGKSYSLAYGNKVPDMAEVMVDDTSSLTLLRADGATVFITGGSYLKFYKHMTELKNGHIWIRLKGDSSSKIHTTNSIANFSESEFIYSFDNASGKSQLLVLSGTVHFSNALEPQLKVKAHSGYFTMVDSSYENGLPRSPTRIGLKSYKRTKQLFVDFRNLQKTKFERFLHDDSIVGKVKRSIASVNKFIKSRRSSSKVGKIISIKSTSRPVRRRVPASVDAFNYYKSKIKHKKIRRNNSKKMRFFGFDKNEKKAMIKMKPQASNTYRKRVPASVKKVKVKAKSRVPASVERNSLLNDLNSDFESSLQQNFNVNRRHSGEVNQLIDELKTYKNQYSKNY